MQIDAVIRLVIEEVVQKHEQPPEVASAIVNWYQQVMTGNEDINSRLPANRNMAFNHIEQIFDHMRSTIDQNDNEASTDLPDEP